MQVQIFAIITAIFTKKLSLEYALQFEIIPILFNKNTVLNKIGHFNIQIFHVSMTVVIQRKGTFLYGEQFKFTENILVIFSCLQPYFGVASFNNADRQVFKDKHIELTH